MQYVTPKTGTFSFSTGSGRFIEDATFTPEQRAQMKDVFSQPLPPDALTGEQIDEIVGPDILTQITEAIHELKAFSNRDVISFIVNEVTSGRGATILVNYFKNFTMSRGYFTHDLD